MVVLEIPEGFLGAARPNSWITPDHSLDIFFDGFFDIVLEPQFFRFWYQLESNLPPNLAPKSTQIRAKRGPNTKPTCIIFSIPFLIDFGSLLGRILVGFGCQVEGQVDQKIDDMASCWQVGRNSNKAKKPFVFQGFLVPRPSNFEAKLSKKRSQTDQKSKKIWVSILIDFLIDFGTNLGRFWEGFGGQVGAKLGPSGNKTRPHKQSKKWSLFGRPPDQFLLNFWSQLGSPGEGRQVVMLMGFRLLWPSWRQDGPKSLQEAPRGAQDSLQDRFWSHFGWFLFDFLIVFLVGLGGSSRLLLLVVVLACCLVGSLVWWFLGLLARCLC